VSRGGTAHIDPKSQPGSAKPTVASPPRVKRPRREIGNENCEDLRIGISNDSIIQYSFALNKTDGQYHSRNRISKALFRSYNTFFSGKNYNNQSEKCLRAMLDYRKGNFTKNTTTGELIKIPVRGMYPYFELYSKIGGDLSVKGSVSW